MTEFNYNKNRDAWGGIRGFVYQVELTIEKWLTLKNDEILELEKGEDIDVVRNHIENVEERELGQVKYRENNLTINSKSFIEAFANFIIHIKNNPKHKLSLHYITNAKIVCEKPAIFLQDKKPIPALKIWEEFQTSKLKYDEEKFKTLLNVVRLNISKLELSEGENQICLEAVEQDSIFFDLVKQTIISSEKPSIDNLSQNIKNQIKDLYKIKDKDSVYYTLFTYVFKILSKKGRKFLDKSQLLELINNQNKHQNKSFELLKFKLITMEKKLNDYYEESKRSHNLTHSQLGDLTTQIDSLEQTIKGINKIDKNKKRYNFFVLSNLLLSENNISKKQDLFENHVINSLKRECNSLDFIIITGNFVDEKSLSNITDLYIDFASVFSKLGIEEHQIIICPGVNEYRKEKASPIVLKTFEAFQDNDEVHDFILSEDFGYSCKPIERYYDFSNSAYNSKEELYSTHFINGNSIGIISINSFWTYSTESDKIIFPLSILEKAYNEIKNAEIKVLISNKPFSCFKRFNKSEIEIYALEKFDILIVENQISNQHFISKEGILEIEIGKSTHEQLKLLMCRYNSEKRTITRTDINYPEINNENVNKDSIDYIIPSEQEKKRQVKVIKRLQASYNRYLEIGNELLVKKENDKSFLKKFTNPLLKDHPKEKEHYIKNVTKNYYEEILSSKNNYLVFGKDKTGKSSLLGTIKK